MNAPEGNAPEGNAPEGNAPEGSEPLHLVLFSGAFDRVHYGLAMAAASLAINRPVTLFLTMGAVHALRHPDPDGPGWRHLQPGENGLAPQEADRLLRERGVGGFEELLSACLLLGARVMVCEMGLRAVGLEADRLRDDAGIVPGGLATFLGEEAREGQILFI